VQHLPAGFTRSFAERLDERTSLSVHEAEHGDGLARGLVLVARGDYHMRFDRDRRVRLDQGDLVNHVRPAVDVTMASAAEGYGPAVIGVVLTGMGADGTRGAGEIRSAGGVVIAEDESTSVVYGMPRSAAKAGHVDQVLPLPEVAGALLELVG
jgi:two-component system chemotaxis response regulator CheB